MVSSVYRKKRDRPVVRIVIGVIIVSLLVIPVASFFYHFNGDSNDYFHSKMLVVPTGSMDGGPTEYEISTIPKDSTIMIRILSESEKDKLKVGDVITFYQNGIYTVHRIISISSFSIITKGDASTSSDVPITKDDVIGKVVGVSVIFGDFVSAVRNLLTNAWPYLIIGLIIVLIMLYYIVVVIHIVREDRISQKIKSGTIDN